MSSVFSLQHHDYDKMVHGKNPVSLRLNDAHHQSINVGDIVEFSGHDSIMDRQKFKVISKMSHPTVEGAINSIHNSNMNVRDKISMANGFRGIHGPDASQHGATTLHLAPHQGPSGYNHSVSSLG